MLRYRADRALQDLGPEFGCLTGNWEGDQAAAGHPETSGSSCNPNERRYLSMGLLRKEAVADEYS